VNATASRIIQSVNALHESGVDLNGHPGVAFFSGTDATNMAVSAALTGAGGTDAVAAARTYADTSSGSTVYTFARGDSSNALAIAELANSTASLDSTSGLGQTSNVAGPPAMLVNGISLTGAAAGTTYTFGWDSGTNTLQLSAAPGGSTADVTATIVPNGSSQLATIDALGVRLAVSVPNSATLSQALSAFVGQSVTTTGSPATIGNQYAEFVASVGVDSSTAQAQSQNQSVLVNQLAQQRESTSGVSLDEEATNLLQYQRAYEAAARVVTINDAMLDTLINHTGAM
jgi:flagellar hook-associated protein 1 FlgK